MVVRKLTDDHKQGDRWEKRAKEDIPQIVLDRIDGTGCATKNEQLHVIDHQRRDLKQGSGCARERLEDRVCKEESRSFGKVGSQ